MDDVDAVQAQIARNMLTSGDWITARLDGVIYLEKPPLIYWLIAISYKIFGVHDWVARLPIALSCMALSWVVAAMGIWAFGRRAGLYAGLCTATCTGLFLFTRIPIPDVTQALTIALALWGMMRALDAEEPHPRLWAAILAVNLGLGLLLKSLIGVVFPVAAGLIYLAFTHQLFLRRTWQRLHVFGGVLIVLAVAAPWHILATLRNPPYFVWTLHSGPGSYKGFLWFFFINEQLLRFLNMRYPRDYDTVPRLYFWAFHLLWLFPWSVYFPAIAKLSFRPVDRAGKLRLLALCWIGFVLVFFSFSTTQEYYSMPCYPALVLLLGCAISQGGKWVERGTITLRVIAGAAAVVLIVLFLLVRKYPAPGDISEALRPHPAAYKLSLGHMEDLTLESFAYLRTALLVAAVAFLVGVIGIARTTSKGARRAVFAGTAMMILFFHAARLAMVKFDPYLSSRPLSNALSRFPDGQLISAAPYYTFASVFFYTNRTALILHGRYNNLEYGSNAPGAPDVFIDDARFKEVWSQPRRCFLLAKEADLPGLERIAGTGSFTLLASSANRLLLTNMPVKAGQPGAGETTSQSDHHGN